MHVIATLRNRSRLAAPLALCLGLALAASAAHAGPAPAKPPRVTAAHLPTWDEVAALYPGFEGGSRKTASSRSTFVLKKNCSSYADGPMADKGRYADYYGAFDNIPVHDGYEQPSVFTMSFASVAAAKRAFKAQQAWIKGCDGKTVNTTMEMNSYDKVSLVARGRPAHRLPSHHGARADRRRPVAPQRARRLGSRRPVPARCPGTRRRGWRHPGAGPVGRRSPGSPSTAFPRTAPLRDVEAERSRGVSAGVGHRRLMPEDHGLTCGERAGWTVGLVGDHRSRPDFLRCS